MQLTWRGMGTADRCSTRQRVRVCAAWPLAHELTSATTRQFAARGQHVVGAGGVGLAGPLFNAQSLGFEQRAAEAQARQALANYEQTILVAFKEVEDALIAIRTARDQREAKQAQVKALRSALHVADLRYMGGITSYVDVLLAKRNLFEAEFSLAAAHRLHLVSIVQLYRALGGGWNPDDEYH